RGMLWFLGGANQRAVCAFPAGRQERAAMIYRCIFACLLAAAWTASCAADGPASAPKPAIASNTIPTLKRFVESHCLDCHDKVGRKGGLALDELSAAKIDRNVEVWEK